MQIDYYVKRIIRSIFALLILQVVVVRSRYCSRSSGGFGCDSGKYCVGNYNWPSSYCATCPAGYYCPGEHYQAQKYMCAGGMYSAAIGATSASMWIDCAAG